MPMQNHRPRRRFSQNFLIDRNYVDRIVRSIAPRKDDHVVEIGPPLEADFDAAGLLEVDGARLVIEESTYRLGAATVNGRILGEPFLLEADTDVVETLAPGTLVAADFELPELEDAVRLEGEGSGHLLADAARLLLEQAGHARIVEER